MVRANKDKRLKVLLVNGSPHHSGNTFTALSEVARTLEEEGMEAEIVHVGNRPVQGCIGCYKGGLPSRRSHRHFRPAEQILHHPQYARRSVTILEQRARAKSGRSLAGCGRPADHAHAGSQHGVDAAQPARQYSPLRNRRKATYKLYPIICV